MKKIIVYGIPNCDTTKMAVAWLRKHHIDFDFHDYKIKGITAAKLNDWAKKMSWEMLLNKRGTTWKKFSPEIKETMVTQTGAVRLMMKYTSLIRRPVTEAGDNIIIGYDEAAYRNIFRTDN